MVIVQSKVPRRRAGMACFNIDFRSNFRANHAAEPDEYVNKTLRICAEDVI
jgi:hypothetical protein